MIDNHDYTDYLGRKIKIRRIIVRCPIGMEQKCRVRVEKMMKDNGLDYACYTSSPVYAFGLFIVKRELEFEYLEKALPS
jgi:hypothetical protein